MKDRILNKLTTILFALAIITSAAILFALAIVASAADLIIPVRLNDAEQSDLAAKLTEARVTATNEHRAALVAWTNATITAAALGQPAPARPTLAQFNLATIVQLSASENVNTYRAEKRRARMETLAGRIRDLTPAQLTALENFLNTLAP